jgi:hypothetical protein
LNTCNAIFVKHGLRVVGDSISFFLIIRGRLITGSVKNPLQSGHGLFGAAKSVSNLRMVGTNMGVESPSVAVTLPETAQESKKQPDKKHSFIPFLLRQGSNSAFGTIKCI